MYIWAITCEEKIGEYEDAYWVNRTDFCLYEIEYTALIRQLHETCNYGFDRRNIKGYGGDLHQLEINL